VCAEAVTVFGSFRARRIGLELSERIAAVLPKVVELIRAAVMSDE